MGGMGDGLTQDDGLENTPIPHSFLNSSVDQRPDSSDDFNYQNQIMNSSPGHAACSPSLGMMCGSPCIYACVTQ